MIFPAGTYYIGDLCYVSSEDLIIKDWDLFLEHTNHLEDYQGTFDSRYCGGDGTYYGDGAYYDNTGLEYLVDSGSIGIIQLKESEQNEIKGGHIHTFEKDFRVIFDHGLFKFGHIIIDTKSDDEYDY